MTGVVAVQNVENNFTSHKWNWPLNLPTNEPSC
jgi:hypothetical protein